jgi:hypothetical protein
MTSHKPHGKPGAAEAAGADLAAAFPALREIFRGYLHEDYQLEHGNANAAVLAFLSVASADERAAASYEAKRLTKRLAGLGLKEVREAVSSQLGAAWQPASLAELARVLKTLATAVG